MPILLLHSKPYTTIPMCTTHPFVTEEEQTLFDHLFHKKECPVGLYNSLVLELSTGSVTQAPALRQLDVEMSRTTPGP